VLIDYWSAHALASRTALRELSALHLNHQDAGFTVVSVNIDHQDDLTDLRQRLTSLDLPYPVGLAKPDSAMALGGLRVVPTRYLIDRDGRIRETYAGAVPLAEIEEDLLKLLR
jgi:cytochrome oxidase Cu insertion factor (SCO1/SenC/PrrC family)